VVLVKLKNGSFDGEKAILDEEKTPPGGVVAIYSEVI